MIHPFFDSIEWNKLEKLEISPPYIPFIQNSEDIDSALLDPSLSNSSG